MRAGCSYGGVQECEEERQYWLFAERDANKAFDKKMNGNTIRNQSLFLKGIKRCFGKK